MPGIGDFLACAGIAGVVLASACYAINMMHRPMKALLWAALATTAISISACSSDPQPASAQLEPGVLSHYYYPD